MLVEDTLCKCTQYLTAACRKESEEHRSQTFHRQVLRGKLRTAVRWITEMEMGGQTSSRGAVQEDGGEGDGGDAHQTP